MKHNIPYGTLKEVLYFRQKITGFGVLTEYQGKGLSKLLLSKSLAFAKEIGLQIKLEVHKNNIIAKKLYKNASFKYLGDYEVYIIRDISVL